MSAAAPARSVATVDRTVWHQRALMIAVASATLAVMLAARNLLFPDDSGTLIIIVAVIGLWCSGRSAVAARHRRVVNGLVVAATALFSWGYLVQLGVLAGWLDVRGLVLLRISVFEWVRALLMSILWFTAFRAFALYTPRDFLLTLVPDMSILLLVCVLDPLGEATVYVVWFAVSAWLAYAAEQKLRLLAHPRAASRVARRDVLAPETRASLLSAVAALIVAFGLTSLLRKALGPGNEMQTTTFRLAWYLSRLMVDLSRTQSPGYTGPIMVGAGPPPFSNQVVLRIRSAVGGYWRGNCYEEFNGIQWSNTRARRRRRTYYAENNGVLRSFTLEAPEATRARRVLQVFNVNTIQMGSILNLGLPIAVQAPMNIGKPRINVEPHGTVTCSQSFIDGNQYRVISLVPEQEDRVLALTPPDPETRQACLAHTASPRTRALARHLTRGLTTTEARARAIEQHLQTSYPYTLSLPPYPRDVDDAVDYFLFETRAGYCVQFASAMAVLCRAADVPARLVTGYAPGDFDPVNQTWVIRDANAHAWVEVWVRDNVWRRYDPTGAGGPRVPGTAVGMVRWITSTFGWMIELVRRLLPEPLARGLAFPLTCAAFTTLALGLVLQARKARRSLQLRRRERSTGADRLDPRLRRLQARFLKQFARVHRVRFPSETLGEYVAAVARPDPARATAAQRFVQTYEQLRYGGAHITDSGIQVLQRQLESLRPAWLARVRAGRARRHDDS